MSADLVVSGAGMAVMAISGLGLLLVTVRLILGPTLGDRILALDTLMMLAIGFISGFSLLTRLWLALDLVLALALVGFLSTAALARYLAGERQDRQPEREPHREPDT